MPGKAAHVSFSHRGAGAMMPTFHMKADGLWATPVPKTQEGL
jgi:hypothetical protein